MNPNVEYEVRATFQAMSDYLLDIGAPPMNRRAYIFLYHNLDSLVAEFESTTGREFANWVGPGFARGDSWIQDHKDFIALNTSAVRYQGKSQSERQNQLAMSIFDIYRRGLTGIWESTPNNAVSREGPRWLQKGAAEYLVYHALESSALEGCYTFRGPYIVSYPSRETALSLGDLETEEGYYSLGKPRRDVFLAAELLEDGAGPGAIFTYYASLNDGSAWQQEFRTAFGMTVEEFYQRFEEHRAAGFPKPGCPTLPPLVTMPGLPDYIKFQVYSEVDPSFVEELVKGARLIYEFGKSLDIPDPAGRIVVHVDSDLQRLALWDFQTRGLPSIEIAREYWEDGGASAGKGLIVFGVPPPEKQRGPDRIGFVVVHELVHSLFQHGLNGRLADPAGFEGRLGVTTPRWLAEGMADALPSYGPPELGRYFSKRRDQALSFMEDTEVTLKDAEVWPSGSFKLFGLEGDQQARAEAIVDCIYHCGYLAAELLASYVGLSRLPDYFMHVESSMFPESVGEAGLPHPGWRLAFKNAYGMTVEEFYESFDAHRAAGFPEVEVPLTLE